MSNYSSQTLGSSGCFLVPSWHRLQDLLRLNQDCRRAKEKGPGDLRRLRREEHVTNIYSVWLFLAEVFEACGKTCGIKCVGCFWQRWHLEAAESGGDWFEVWLCKHTGRDEVLGFDLRLFHPLWRSRTELSRQDWCGDGWLRRSASRSSSTGFMSAHLTPLQTVCGLHQLRWGRMKTYWTSPSRPQPEVWQEENSRHMYE